MLESAAGEKLKGAGRSLPPFLLMSQPRANSRARRGWYEDPARQSATPCEKGPRLTKHLCHRRHVSSLGRGITAAGSIRLLKSHWLQGPTVAMMRRRIPTSCGPRHHDRFQHGECSSPRRQEDRTRHRLFMTSSARTSPSSSSCHGPDHQCSSRARRATSGRHRAGDSPSTDAIQSSSVASSRPTPAMVSPELGTIGGDIGQSFVRPSASSAEKTR